MSAANQVFIKKQITISELKSILEELLNSKLIKIVDADLEIYSTIVIGLHISLIETSGFFEDDGGVKFF